jgi:hypothetical protein
MNLRKVTSSLWVLGLLLSEEASKGNNVSVNLLDLLSAGSGRHRVCVFVRDFWR